MNPLVELANRTWNDLEKLIEDFDNQETERTSFINETCLFFQQRLSIYQQKRIELENHVEKLIEQMNQLSDELQMSRIVLQSKLNLKQKRIFINEKIDHLKNLIFERDKELIQLRLLINQKVQLIGNIQLQTEQVRLFFNSSLKSRKKFCSSTDQIFE